MKAVEPPGLRTVRILICSPGDVADERERARQTIESLRRRYARRFVIKHLLWEDLPLQPDMPFQEGIELLLSRDGGVDVVVFILWSRLGSPVGPELVRHDGSEYRSGTEREFELMMQARAQSDANHPRPDILFYRRDDENSFLEGLRGLPIDQQQELVEQKKLVEKFFSQQFSDAEKGFNLRAYHTYDRPAAFSERLRIHLQDLLDRMAEGLTHEPIWDIERQGPPFMGLAAFQPWHADVFFGREDEILEARRALREQARAGRAFLLLCGASGSGKSSLARAGVLPAIVENELDAQVAAWRTVVTTPFELAPDPVAALITQISAEEVFPELVEGTSVAGVVDVFRRYPNAVKPQLESAFSRADARFKGQLRLLLVIDQLEELFASAAVNASQRAEFLAALETLAGSGRVWIVATIRADFYEQLQSEPVLVKLKSGLGQLDVLPPGADALRRMVEEPAHLAGLRFEKRADGQTLADVILRDAATHPELLPLIEDLLRELYERRDGDLLTFVAFQGLGNSVERALGRRAEEVFLKLPADARASLGSVLQELVTLGENAEDLSYTDLGATHAGGEHVVRQHALLGTFPENTPARRLVDTFVAARLFTAARHPKTGAATITVAHESLLRVWHPAVDWAERNRDFLHTRAHVAQRLREGSPLLAGDPLFGAAKDHFTRNPDGFPPDLRTFIKKSVKKVEQRKRGIYSAVAAALLLVLGLFVFFTIRRTNDAIGGQLVAEAERNMSQRDFARAEIRAARALAFRDDPTTRQLLVDARSGGVRFVDGSQKREESHMTFVSADGLVRASVAGGGDAGPVVVTVVATSSPAGEWRVSLPASVRTTDSIAVSRANGAGRELAIAWSDGTNFHVDLRRLEPGKEPGAHRELTGDGTGAGRHTKRIPSMSFHPMQPWIATSGEDTKIALWDYSAESPRLIWEHAKAHSTNVHGIAFNADGSLLASGGGDYKVRVWETAKMTPGATIVPQELDAHTDSVFAVAFSPNGKFLASAGYDRLVRIWDLALKDAEGNHPTVGTLSGHEGTVLALAFSDDSGLLISGGKDETVRLWDVSEGRLLVTITPGIGEIRSVALRDFEGPLSAGGSRGWSVWSVRGHSMATRLWNGGATIGAIAFDPTGRWIAAGGSDGKVRVWDRQQSFRAPRVLDANSPDAGESINGIAFSHDGRWLAAAGEASVIHIWDARSEWAKVRSPDGALRHDGGIWGLCFDPQGRWLYSSNTDSNARIRRWNVGTWMMQDQTSELRHAVWSLACAPDGKRLVSGDANGTVVVRETDRLGTVHEITNVKSGEANVWSVAVTESPVSVLSGNSDGRVRRWIPADREWTGAAKESIAATGNDDAKINPTINSISYSRKTGWIAAAGDGPSVEIYDANLEKVRSLRGHSGTVWFVVFAADGVRLAYGGTGRILRIFDLEEMNRDLNVSSPDELYDASVLNTGLEVVDDKIVAAARAK